MFKMTIAHLGMVVIAICLSTQVMSDANATTPNNSTDSRTITPTETFSSSTNTTHPTGASVSLNAGGVYALTPVIMAALLLQPYC